MEFSELIKSRYSCRAFSDRKVSANLLYELLSNAINAPSAKNSQPWVFYVAYQKEQADKIRACLCDEGRNAFLSDVPAFIVLLEKEPQNITCSKYSNDRFVKYDIGEICAYITLSAKNIGLDTCIIGWVNEKKLQEAIFSDLPCGIVIAVGYASKSEAPPKKRIPIEEKIINYTNDFINS